MRLVHGAALGGGDRILVVYDDTLFGTAAHGFVMTDAKFLWSTMFGKPECLAWDELDVGALAVEGYNVALMGVMLTMTYGDAAQLAGLIRTLATHASIARQPYRSGPVRVADEEDLAREVRRHLGLNNALHYAPWIPPAKERAARREHAGHLAAEEPIVALHDDTVWGGAKNGFVITPRRICWKSAYEAPVSLAWHEVGEVHLARKDRLRVGDKVLNTICVDTQAVLPRLKVLLEVMAAKPRA